ncbi:ABC transporter ATP-binding protein/permease [Candidatus Aquarickettsia rohweri]|uniref:ABC transporter ATP-binding protein/permease n=1 Tax=Candidatus Aquarickettsia rohweri TaxID=2602574 RepID=A0A429XSJ5_9RICK|nr:ABC transporter ATP-binding protein/permease [Candidatus Aquarickettsia rohweri]RST70025.1 ABC transporter ATP-binding protein/permease [Candidatus Aquarickettsia rohweri]
MKKERNLFILWIKLVTKFFISEKKKIAIIGITGLVAFEFFNVYLSVRLTKWSGTFYDALQNLDKVEFQKQILVFAILAFIFIITSLLKTVSRLWYSLEWRIWKTENIVNKWIKGNNYYIAKAINKEIDNPDQRIANDIKEFSTISIELFLGIIQAVTTLISFIIILWSLSGVFEFKLYKYTINIPGYLVWVALIYALLGTYLTHKIGRPLSEILFKGEKKEADFRYQLIRTRENAEAIAMYDAGEFEKDGIMQKFTKIVKNTKKMIFREMKIISFVSFYNQTAIILPILVLAPRYFAAAITLGVLMQTIKAFDEIKTALSWMIESYINIATLKAVVERLYEFQNSIEKCEEENKKNEVQIKFEGSNIQLKNLEICLPNGEKILEKTTDKIIKNNYILKGENGSGKSTIFRTLKGIWPYSSGEIIYPKNSKIMFIPQKGYMPYEKLRLALIYPLLEHKNTQYIEHLLESIGLNKLKILLNKENEWERILSGGEKQKIAIIRSIINRPDILFLDESFSSMDEKSEIISLNLLNQELKNTTIILITHKNKAIPKFNKVINKNKLCLNFNH